MIFTCHLVSERHRDHLEREHNHHHGQLHKRTVAHYPNLCSRQLFQRHVRVNAGWSQISILRRHPILMAVNFQAPFYPREAAKKGLEVYAFGLVFGTFEVKIMLVILLIGLNTRLFL